MAAGVLQPPVVAYADEGGLLLGLAGSGGGLVCTVLPQPAGVAVLATAATGSPLRACVPVTRAVIALAGGAPCALEAAAEVRAAGDEITHAPPPPTFLSERSVVLWEAAREGLPAPLPGAAAAAPLAPVPGGTKIVWQATLADRVTGVAASQDAGLLGVATGSATVLWQATNLVSPVLALATQPNPGGCIAMCEGPLIAYAPADDATGVALAVARLEVGGSLTRAAMLQCATPPRLWRLSRCGRLLAVASDGGASVDLYSVIRGTRVVTFRRGILGSALSALAFFHVRRAAAAAVAAAAVPTVAGAAEDAASPDASWDALPTAGTRLPASSYPSPSWLAVGGASPTIHIFAIPGAPPVTPGGAMHAAMYAEYSDDSGDVAAGSAGTPGEGGSEAPSSAVGAALAAAAGGATRLARRLGGQRAFTIARVPPPHADDGIAAVAITATPAPPHRALAGGGGPGRSHPARPAVDDTAYDGADDFSDVVSTSLLGAPRASAPVPAPSVVVPAHISLRPGAELPQPTMDFVLTAVTTRGVILQYLIDATGSSAECTLTAVHTVGGAV